jgi:hypothetical protein
MATSTQSIQPAGHPNVAVGRYVNGATAAAFTITTGFKPRVVRVFNKDIAAEMEWVEGMADDSALKRLALTSSSVTGRGITPTANGFTVGLDTDFNLIADQLSWIAIG